MTTIAYKDGVLCTDRLAVDAMARKLCDKVWILPEQGVAIAVTGFLSAGIRFRDWWADGKKKDDDWTLDDETTVVVLHLNTGAVETYDSNMVAIPILDKLGAWGSGADYALGAMEAGVDAVRAVEIAAKYSIGTGYGLAVIDINDHKKVKNYAHWRNWKGRKR